MKSKKTLMDFENTHGQPKIKELTKQLEVERAKVEALADVQNKTSVILSKGNTLRFGLVGCSHFGSLHANMAAMEAFYEYAKGEGISVVYHGGDVMDGHRVYRGQEFELRDVGLEDQLKRVAKFNASGIVTKFITGNHDQSFKNLAGVPVGHMIEKCRENGDFEFLGEEQARVRFETDAGPYELMLIHPGGGSSYALCFDDQTEVMTKDRGFVLFKDLTQNDLVATRSAEGEFQWQKPTGYTDQAYSGTMYHFKARCFDLMVTPNHRMLVRRYATAVEYARAAPGDLTYPTKSHYSVDTDWKYVEAQDLASARRQQWQMTRVAESWAGVDPEYVVIPFREPKKYASTPVKHIGRLAVEDAAELIAWYVTEGHIGRKGKQLTICQSRRVNPGSHAEIIDLLRRIGFDNAVGRGRDQKNITVCSVELCDWLREQCGSGSANKHLPTWLKNCSSETLRLVLETMIKGDGWANGVSWGYRSISKQLRNDVSEIAIKLGIGATEWNDSVSLSIVQNYPTINQVPASVNYTGRIYCVTVPNSNILVRRNGRTVFSGNSYRPQKIVESLEGGNKPNMLAIAHYHKAEFMPSYRNVSAIQTGTFQNQTPFMARQGLAAHVGGWVVDVRVGKGYNAVKAEFIAFY